MNQGTSPRRAVGAREHNGPVLREEEQHLIEVHVSGICIRAERDRWKLLAGKRTEDRAIFPGKWECGGGQVHRGETFESAVERQILEEFTLRVIAQNVIATYSIRIPGLVIPGVRLLCVAQEEVVLFDRREFSECRWVDLPVPDLDWIPGLKDVLDVKLQRHVYPGSR